MCELSWCTPRARRIPCAARKLLCTKNTKQKREKTTLSSERTSPHAAHPHPNCYLGLLSQCSRSPNEFLNCSSPKIANSIFVIVCSRLCLFVRFLAPTPTSDTQWNERSLFIFRRARILNDSYRSVRRLSVVRFHSVWSSILVHGQLTGGGELIITTIIMVCTWP